VRAPRARCRAFARSIDRSRNNGRIIGVRGGRCDASVRVSLLLERTGQVNRSADKHRAVLEVALIANGLTQRRGRRGKGNPRAPRQASALCIAVYRDGKYTAVTCEGPARS